ncbi:MULTISPECIES: hypothetical protein [Bacillaceae]|uniref:hypothetical protein n=1 Tax=Bacillaceae TaxID=186817 RepID=UPI001E58D17F|nr:hypothetical protein [Bacillus sp. Au-Bac7]MCE4049344.1 hypothetical protein [Bacillus sp. Au-Bac7]
MKMELGILIIEEGTFLTNNRKKAKVQIVAGKYPIYANISDSNTTPMTCGSFVEAYVDLVQMNNTKTEQFHYIMDQKELVEKILKKDENIILHDTFHIRQDYYVYDAKLFKTDGLYFKAWDSVYEIQKLAGDDYIVLYGNNEWEKPLAIAVTEGLDKYHLLKVDQGKAISLKTFNIHEDLFTDEFLDAMDALKSIVYFNRL